jgi:hypothetical protein
MENKEPIGILESPIQKELTPLQLTLIGLFGLVISVVFWGVIIYLIVR